MENIEDFLRKFARKFVNGDYRARFVHKALHRPVRLHQVMCHDMERAFAPHFKGNPPPFVEDDCCVLITSFGQIERFVPASWSVLRRYEKSGFGLLWADLALTGFYAETEQEYGNPSISYASVSS